MIDTADRRQHRRTEGDRGRERPGDVDVALRIEDDRDIAIIAGTTVGGRVALRACIVNPGAERGDIDVLVASILEQGARLRLAMRLSAQ